MSVLVRHDELLALLRRRADWTIAELAGELSVSERTILRDIARLRERGFDISSMSGPGGGVHLEPTSVLVTSQLTEYEVVALILAVAVARSMPWIPFADGAERALAKIQTALPARRADQLQRFMQRVLIGDPGPPSARNVRPPDMNLVATFERAFAHQNLFQFDYVDRQDHSTSRLVEPHGLLLRAPLWYVIAWDPSKDAARLFRADRISKPHITDASFVPRPHDLISGVCPDARPLVEDETAGPGVRCVAWQ